MRGQAKAATSPLSKGTLLNDSLPGSNAGVLWEARVDFVSRFTAAGFVCMRWKHATLLQSSLEYTWTWSNAIPGLQRPKSFIGKCLEVIIGDCTFFAIVQRGALWRPSTIRKSYRTRAKMWPSVRQELDIFCSLLLFSYTRIGARRFPNGEEAGVMVTSTVGSREVRHTCSAREKHAFVVSTQSQPALTHWVSLGMLGFKWSVTR